VAFPLTQPRITQRGYTPRPADQREAFTQYLFPARGGLFTPGTGLSTGERYTASQLTDGQKIAIHANLGNLFTGQKAGQKFGNITPEQQDLLRAILKTSYADSPLYRPGPFVQGLRPATSNTARLPVHPGVSGPSRTYNIFSTEHPAALALAKLIGTPEYAPYQSDTPKGIPAGDPLDILRMKPEIASSRNEERPSSVAADFMQERLNAMRTQPTVKMTNPELLRMLHSIFGPNWGGTAGP